ncbi:MULTISPECIES: tetratricopeptide repeat protein [Acidiphilium]|uniref:tetratricopeptide repeat protein n=1 Tax=Acidiphilium TaxID=522 RepID=UPI002579C026|nr:MULTISPECIES: tetratricopeptide repeat protein [Acidiphilium]HQT84959.1 tetratricopeptide repeat protein [Acidiphilium rubrum]
MNHIGKEFESGSIQNTDDLQKNVEIILSDIHDIKNIVKAAPSRSENVLLGIGIGLITNILYDWIKPEYKILEKLLPAERHEEDVVQVEWHRGWYYGSLIIDNNIRQSFLDIQKLGGIRNPKACVFYDAVGMIDDLSKAHRRAEAYRRSAVELSRRVHGRNHESTAAAMSNLGLCMFAQGRISNSEDLYIKSLKILRNCVGDNNIQTAGVVYNLYANLYKQGRTQGMRLPSEFKKIIPTLPEAAHHILRRKYILTMLCLFKESVENIKNIKK